MCLFESTEHAQGLLDRPARAVAPFAVFWTFKVLSTVIVVLSLMLNGEGLMTVDDIMYFGSCWINDGITVLRVVTLYIQGSSRAHWIDALLMLT